MSSPPEPVLTLAVLGLGAAGRAHARLLARDHPGVRVLLAGREPHRAARGSRVVSADDALADATVDAVLIATPPHTHLPLTIDALRAGKHVVVEKPAFCDTAELACARRAAEQADRRLLVAENYPYKPLARRLRTIVAEQLVGDPVLLLVDAVKHQPATGWRTDVGALLEGGIHWISLMSSLGIPVDAARTQRAGSATGPDRSTVCTLTYRQGMVGVLAYSWQVPSPLRGVRLSHLYGTGGTVTFESNGGFVALRGRRRRVWPLDPRDPSGARAMWRDLLAALRDGRAPRYDLDHAARDLALVESGTSSRSRPDGA
jgi:predicted dehydrogenase